MRHLQKLCLMANETESVHFVCLSRISIAAVRPLFCNTLIHPRPREEEIADPKNGTKIFPGKRCAACLTQRERKFENEDGLAWKRRSLPGI
ncbi:hypothetical protein V6N12_022027 [Hibiscus sabdariffa]|uniref:Uncharacterized protein n=1 Tax=Hibiscus sabdariffa TaxID=183260 RepID=A0ABR2FTG1_9ROSI